MTKQWDGYIERAADSIEHGRWPFVFAAVAMLTAVIVFGLAVIISAVK